MDGRPTILPGCGQNRLTRAVAHGYPAGMICASAFFLH
jgi:hypothetical protein